MHLLFVRIFLLVVSHLLLRLASRRELDGIGVALAILSGACVPTAPAHNTVYRGRAQREAQRADPLQRLTWTGYYLYHSNKS